MVSLKILSHELDNKGILNTPIYTFESCHKINIVSGNSGSGKTRFADIIQLAITGADEWYIECNYRVRILRSAEEILEMNTNIELIILDEDVMSMIRKKLGANSLEKYNKYFIILDRGSATKMDINVKSIFSIIETDNVIEDKYVQYKIVSKFGLTKSEEYEGIESFVTEDEKSGLSFWKLALRKLKVIDINTYGNSNVTSNIKYALNKYQGNCLIALDYDRGASVIDDILKDRDIDNRRIFFLNIECFEELICNSDFILSKYPNIKDRVINYQNYMDCTYGSTGKYFSKILHDVVRVKSPIKKPGDRNITEFYEKDMKNFVECFIKDCCSYDKDDCTLKYDGNKIEAMLDNKFKFLRQFI